MLTSEKVRGETAMLPRDKKRTELLPKESDPKKSGTGLQSRLKLEKIDPKLRVEKSKEKSKERSPSINRIEKLDFNSLKAQQVHTVKT